MQTPEQLRAHLSTLVTGPVAVARMVHVRFPDWSPRPLSHVVAPVVEDGMDERAQRATQGSRNLLAALWKAHAPILCHYAAKGLQVDKP